MLAQTPQPVLKKIPCVDNPVLVNINDVTVQYNTAEKITIGVYKVSFNIHQGERVTIVGKSGCGKSTLLNTVAGFLKPVSGEILLEGVKIKKPGPERIVVFQEHGLLPWRTAVENVMFPLMEAKKYSKEQAYAKAEQTLHLVGLQGLNDKYPHQLSGGQRQRVSIARAFAMEPKVLLMDEPYSALDQITKGTLQDELIALCEATKATVMFITHDIREAIKIGHRIMVLSSHPGQVIGELHSSFHDGAQAIEDQKAQIENLLGLK